MDILPIPRRLSLAVGVQVIMETILHGLSYKKKKKKSKGNHVKNIHEKKKVSFVTVVK